MASQQLIDQFEDTLDRLRGVDKERLLRKALGEESLLQSGFSETLEAILKKAAFALQYWGAIDDGILQTVRNIFENLWQMLDNQAKRANAEYVQQRTNFITQVNQTIQQLAVHWCHFVTAAVEARGFLEDEGIRREYDETVNEMKTQADEALNHVKAESAKTIEEARKLAQQIEERARRTAAHISVEAAQEQFRLGQKDLDGRVKLWGWLSAAALAGFLGVAIFLSRVELPDKWQWHVVYYTAIRVTILTAVGAMATFCLRILRAHMHMSQHNRHRQRVANSMQAFVEAALTPEQRDLILAELVNAVVDFGTSGLLSKEDDAIYTSKMTIDSITRTIAQPPTKA